MADDSDSAVAEEGEVAPPPLPLLEDIISWGKTHRPPLDASVSPPPKLPWSMVAIRHHKNHGDYDNPPIIFPPINHENLHISPHPPPTPAQIPHIHSDIQRMSFSDTDSDSDSNSSSTFSPSDSSPPPRSPLFSNLGTIPAANAAVWFDYWTEMLSSKVNGLVRFFCSVFTSSRGVFLTSRSAAFTAVLIAFMYFRRRRRRVAAGEESRDWLIGIIKQRDEKINQLLDQISRMNQMLLSLQRVPSSTTS